MALKRNFEISNRLTLSLEKAFKFMEDSRNSDGLWSDFLTLAGESVFWVSGYVGYALIATNKFTMEKGCWTELVRESLQNRMVMAAGVMDMVFLLMLIRLLGVFFFFQGLVAEPGRATKALMFLLKHQNLVDGVLELMPCHGCWTL
jgi:hypothetical protein